MNLSNENSRLPGGPTASLLLKDGMGFGLKQILTIVTIALLGLVSACGQMRVSSDCDCGFFASGAKLMVWPANKRDVSFYFHNSIPTEAKAAIQAAAKNYNEALQDRLTITVHEDDANSPIQGKAATLADARGDGVNGIYWIDGEWPFTDADGDHEDGMTFVQFSHNGISETDIFIRGQSFPHLTKDGFVAALAADYGTFEVKTATIEEKTLYLLMNHEFGHAVGRNHEQKEVSIMRPMVSFSSLDSPLSPFDLGLLQGAYPTR